MFEAQCQCGAIALTVDGKPSAQVFCHCSDCQLAQGAAYVLNAVYRAGAIRITRGIPIAMSVRTTQRLRCGACGTPLYTEVLDAGLRSLNAYLLPPGTFAPQLHIHCADAVLPIVDTLPHYAGLPASFGGSDEQVDW